tara:strand:+ start:90 stop:209 length:120 start_codon:yes stop_codon:yes gene_type:complete
MPGYMKKKAGMKKTKKTAMKKAGTKKMKMKTSRNKRSMY